MQHEFVILVVISVLVVALVYSSFTPFIVFAAPQDPLYGTGTEDCKTEKKDGWIYSACCWKKDGKTYCQTCKTDGKTSSCDPVQGPIGLTQGGSGSVFPGDEGVLEQPPRPPTFGPVAPLQGGVFEQQEPETPPTFAPGLPGVINQPQPEMEILEQQPPSEEGAQPLTGPSPFSPTGGCVSTIKTHCVPCDLGLPVGGCTPSGEWPPVLSTDEGIPQSSAPPTGPLVEETAPEAEQPPTTEETQPATADEEPLPPCPAGQELDEQTNLCVPIESQDAEQPQEADEESQEQPGE